MIRKENMRFLVGVLLLVLVVLGLVSADCAYCERFSGGRMVPGCKIECANEAGWCCIRPATYNKMFKPTAAP